MYSDSTLLMINTTIHLVVFVNGERFVCCCVTFRFSQMVKSGWNDQIRNSIGLTHFSSSHVHLDSVPICIPSITFPI